MRCSTHDWQYLGATGPHHSIYRFRCKLCKRTGHTETLEEVEGTRKLMIKEDV